MWQRFTERARKIVFYAQEEAQKVGCGYVDTEHLLLGLIRESDHTAGHVFALLNVIEDQIREEIEKRIQPQAPREAQDMTLTPGAKRVIDLAYDEARALNNNYIGSEHLLLGILRESEGLAGKVLASLKVELDAARNFVRQVQEEGREVTAPEPAPPVKPLFTETFNKAAETLVNTVRARGGTTIGTGEYLRAFLSDPKCAAYKVLLASGADLAKLLEDIPTLPSRQPVEDLTVTLTPDLKQASATAVRIRREMDSPLGTTAHFLLAMLEPRTSIVSALIWKHYIPYEHLWMLTAELGADET